MCFSLWLFFLSYMKCKPGNIEEDDNCQTFSVQVNENADEIIFFVPDLHCCQLWSFSHTLSSLSNVSSWLRRVFGLRIPPWNPCMLEEAAAMEKPCWFTDRMPQLPQIHLAQGLKEEGTMGFTVSSNDKPRERVLEPWAEEFCCKTCSRGWQLEREHMWPV